jgi:hypothetical protein
LAKPSNSCNWFQLQFLISRINALSRGTRHWSYGCCFTDCPRLKSAGLLEDSTATEVPENIISYCAPFRVSYSTYSFHSGRLEPNFF